MAEVVRVGFSELVALIEEQLTVERRVGDYASETGADIGHWSRGAEAAEVRPSTSTGILLRLFSSGLVIHERIYAASPMSVPRMVRSITEHLTGYAAY
jgi:hypothetical protein